MSEFAKAWRLSRGRLIETIAGLNHAQLNWRIHPAALTIAQMSVHVAGVEVSFASQLNDLKLNPDELRLKESATDGVVNDLPFPFSMEELTPEFVAEKLRISEAILEPLMDGPTAEVEGKTIVSALGPVITGDMALARLSFHSAYHQGQAYMIRTAPTFPE